MQDRDFANRFEAFYIGFNEYNGDLDMFLNDMMGRLNKMTRERLDEIKVAFDKSMKCCYALLGSDAFRRPYPENKRRSPISKSIFDAMSVNIAWLSDDQRASLVAKKVLFKTELDKLFDDEDYKKAISTGTGQKANVLRRFRKIDMVIKKVLAS